MKKFVDADTLKLIANKWIKDNFKESEEFDFFDFNESFNEFLHEYLLESLDEDDETIDFELDPAFRFSDLVSDYVGDLRDAYDYKNPYCG